MHSNKRYDYIVDMTSLLFNSRHIIGFRLPESKQGIFFQDLVIETISDPVLIDNVNTTTIIKTVEDI